MYFPFSGLVNGGMHRPPWSGATCNKLEDQPRTGPDASRRPPLPVGPLKREDVALLTVDKSLLRPPYSRYKTVRGALPSRQSTTLNTRAISLLTKAIMSTTQTDLLIIGGGPAGLSAAITFSRLRRPCVIYDSGNYRNASASHSHTILGFEGQDPADFRAKVRSELLRDYSTTTTFRNGQIVSLVKTGEEFEAKDAEGNTLKARKVILATGLKDHLPDILGVSYTFMTVMHRCS